MRSLKSDLIQEFKHDRALIDLLDNLNRSLVQIRSADEKNLSDGTEVDITARMSLDIAAKWGNRLSLTRHQCKIFVFCGSRGSSQ